MRFKDILSIRHLSEFQQWLNQMAEDNHLEDNYDRFAFVDDSIHELRNSVSPEQHQLLVNFMRETFGQELSGFIINEMLRNTIGLRSRSWLTYKEYCEEKRKENL